MVDMNMSSHLRKTNVPFQESVAAALPDTMAASRGDVSKPLLDAENLTLSAECSE